MSILSRPVVVVLATGLSLGLAASPAAAAPTQAKATVKSKGKSASKAKAKAKKKVTVKAPPKADLTLKALHVDVSDEGTLLVTANLLNLGRGFAAPSSVAIALSTDDTLSDDELLDELPFDRIGAGVTRRIDTEVDVPFDVDTSEDLQLLVCADADAVITERSESNNCVSQDVTLDDLAPADDAATAGDDGTDDSGSAAATGGDDSGDDA